MLGIFISSLLVGYSGALMPGSLLTYTIDKSIKRGAKAGILISLGHSLLEMVLVILIIIGAGKYLGTKPVQTIIGIAGGILLIYLGIGMIKDVVLNKLNVDFHNKSDYRSGNMVLEGAVISASNPYFIFWWTVVGIGLIMKAYSAYGILGVTLFYLGHISSDISWYSLISVIISKTRKFINLRVYRIVVVVLGVFLTSFGAKFLVDSIKKLLYG